MLARTQTLDHTSGPENEVGDQPSRKQVRVQMLVSCYMQGEKVFPQKEVSGSTLLPLLSLSSRSMSALILPSPRKAGVVQRVAKASESEGSKLPVASWL